jgi:hypothetical protein
MQHFRRKIDLLGRFQPPVAFVFEPPIKQAPVRPIVVVQQLSGDDHRAVGQIGVRPGMGTPVGSVR